MPTTIDLEVAGLGTVPLTYSRTGVAGGAPMLVLHGGGGPATIAAWSERAGVDLPADVVAPVHPGFDFTDRPAAVDSPAAVARVELALLDALDLRDVTVVGNSIGGWIALELALLASPRVARVVLLDAVGIRVDGHPAADFFTLTPAGLAELTFFDPGAFALDPTALPEPVRRRTAANRAPLAVYSGGTGGDPGLRPRLAGLDVPTLVVRGEADGIVDLAYTRALAASIPGARLEIVAAAGHVPQIEQPAAVTALVREFIG